MPSRLDELLSQVERQVLWDLSVRDVAAFVEIGAAQRALVDFATQSTEPTPAELAATAGHIVAAIVRDAAARAYDLELRSLLASVPLGPASGTASPDRELFLELIRALADSQIQLGQEPPTGPRFRDDVCELLALVGRLLERALRGAEAPSSAASGA